MGVLSVLDVAYRLLKLLGICRFIIFHCFLKDSAYNCNFRRRFAQVCSLIALALPGLRLLLICGLRILDTSDQTSWFYRGISGS